MKPVTLYKKHCDPYVVNSQEELTFHKNQGWVEDKSELDKEPEIIQPVKPYNVLDEGDQATTANLDAAAKIKELEEIVAAKDATISEMQTDFEEVFTGLNSTITQLKDQLTVLGMTPVTDVPKAPKAPAARPGKK